MYRYPVHTEVLVERPLLDDIPIPGTVSRIDRVDTIIIYLYSLLFLSDIVVIVIVIVIVIFIVEGSILYV
jgi:hypothetical protein